MKEEKKEKIFTGIFIVMMISSALTSFCNYFFYSTMPMYAEKIGVPTELGGIIVGVYTISCLITRTFAGSLCDRFGRYIIMIIGAILCILGSFGYMLAFSLIPLIAMRAIHGIGFGTNTTATSTVAVDVLPKSRRMEGLGYFALYSTVASALGPMIALSVVDHEKLGFNALFALSGTLMIVALVLNLCVGKTIKAAKPVTAPEKEGSKPKTFLGFEAKGLPPACIMMLLSFAQSGIMAFLAIYAKENGIDNIGLFFTISSVAIFLSRFFVGKIGDRWGIKTALIPSIILASASLAIIALFPIRTVILICAVPYGLGFGAAGPIINTLVVNSCDDSHRSSATSMYYASLDIGIGIGSSVLGVVAAAVGYKYMILIASAIALSSLAIFFFIAASRKKTINVQEASTHAS